MLGRTLSGFTVLAMAGVLSGVLSGHLWNRYSQETEALGFSGIYERSWPAKQDSAMMLRAIEPHHAPEGSTKPQLWKSR